jgi:hypothetical protein
MFLARIRSRLDAVWASHRKSAPQAELPSSVLGNPLATTRVLRHPATQPNISFDFMMLSSCLTPPKDLDPGDYDLSDFRT